MVGGQRSHVIVVMMTIILWSFWTNILPTDHTELGHGLHGDHVMFESGLSVTFNDDKIFGQ